STRRVPPLMLMPRSRRYAGSWASAEAQTRQTMASASRISRPDASGAPVKSGAFRPAHGALRTKVRRHVGRLDRADQERRGVRRDPAEERRVLAASLQGVARERHRTAVRRGGSDTAAVGLAAARHAAECHILAHVDRVYTTAPRIVPEARHLRTVSFEQMLEM